MRLEIPKFGVDFVPRLRRRRDPGGALDRVSGDGLKPFFGTTVRSRKAGPPGFLTPRSQSETRFLGTLR